MSEDSSSDEELWLPTERTVCRKKLNCWECGKNFPNMHGLMSHYLSHNVPATCHICKITFRRLTSLSTHLDNVHPRFCKMCGVAFNNVWELNKHAETDCRSAVYLDEPRDNCCNEVTIELTEGSEVCDAVPDPRPIETKEIMPGGPETSDNSIEYIVGEDDKDTDSDEVGGEDSDSSTTSESDDTDETVSGTSSSDKLEENDGSNSRSMDLLNKSSNPPPSKIKQSTPPKPDSLFCHVCNRGPFRSVKVHMRFCCGVKVKRCHLCFKEFPTEEALKEHRLSLYKCHICEQVLSTWTLYKDHQCPKGIRSPCVLFCSGYMPKACKICKSFFTCERALLNHVAKVHTKLVSTKFCILTNPSLSTDQKISPVVSGTAVITSPSYSGQSPSGVNQVINGNVFVGQPFASSMPTAVRPSAGVVPKVSTFANGVPAKIMIVQKMLPNDPQVVQQQSAKNQAAIMVQNNIKRPHVMQKPPLHAQPSGSSSHVRTSPIKTTSSAAHDTQMKDALVNHNNLPQTHPTTPVVSEKPASSPPAPTIMAMFENGSHDVALMKRMNTSWRFKASYPCRHCGAMSRQPALIISHRYLHRGRRSHLCQCGRAFKHRLHLLRHCIQHAEATSYICVSCGETFTGAKLLAKHMKGKSKKKPHPSGHTSKHRHKNKCMMPLTCDCGRLFLRPSAYIWHQLKNRAQTKQWDMQISKH
ncbi:zinc finger protein 841 isoform X2 [Sphaeramia orbicularis]|nr:zinc finger protein 841-like isoform X2 [Sphaeramia orbicularis]XP_030014585.1 zinc finger protein 841-like isoform X2 [Sphaeramia orbicularis]